MKLQWNGASQTIEKFQIQLEIQQCNYPWLLFHNQKKIHESRPRHQYQTHQESLTYKLQSEKNVTDFFRILQETCAHKTPTKHRQIEKTQQGV